MNEEVSLITFKAICNFVNDLSSVYGKNHRPLKLYQRLINQTQISHTKVINKHIDACRRFCIDNRDALMSQDPAKLVNNRITYSIDKVFIDMRRIFNLSDSETNPIIWRHLLTISALVDPAGNAKQILAKNVENGKSGQLEADFLTNIISKVESNVKADANPMEAISSIMQSGVFNELLSGMQGGMQSGELDMGKLLGAVQGMVGSLSEQAGDDPETKQAMGMLNNMTSLMGNLGNAQKNGQPPDMSGMMSMMTTMMAGMSTVEDVSTEDNEKKID